MPKRLSRAVLDQFTAFTDHFGIDLFPWQREAFSTATARRRGRFVYRLAGISVPRGDGKSFAGAAVGVWRLLAGPEPQDIVSAALDLDGAQVVLDHARRIVRSHPDLERSIDVRASSLHVPATGSRWTITSREHTASRGRHPTLVLYDEVGWARDDELFASLLSGQTSVTDPLMLVVSTVGRRQAGPLWTVKQLGEGGDASTFWWWQGENRSPLVSPRFIAQQRRILLPAQFAREHQNAWVDLADSFATSREVDAAMGHGWSERTAGEPGIRYVAAVDLGAVHDPTVIAVAHDDDGTVYVDRLLTFQGSRSEPVQLSAVDDAIRDLAERFSLHDIWIESWQGLASAQSLARLGLPVKLFTPTAKAHAEQWPLLASRLSAGTLVLPTHACLREELLNLVVEMGPQGVKVVDRGKIHQDHAVAVRMTVAMLAASGADVTASLNWAVSQHEQGMALRRRSPWRLDGESNWRDL